MANNVTVIATICLGNVFSKILHIKFEYYTYLVSASKVIQTIVFFNNSWTYEFLNGIRIKL